MINITTIILLKTGISNKTTQDKRYETQCLRRKNTRNTIYYCMTVCIFNN